jgi:hypothetical protein
LKELSDAWRALNRDIPNFAEWVKSISESLDMLEEKPLVDDADLAAIMTRLEVKFQFYSSYLCFAKGWLVIAVIEK